MRTQTVHQLAKSLMDKACADNVVEYTAPYRDVLNLRSECYKLRSYTRDMNKDIYDMLSFGTRPEPGGLLTLVMEKK